MMVSLCHAEMQGRPGRRGRAAAFAPRRRVSERRGAREVGLTWRPPRRRLSVLHHWRPHRSPPGRVGWCAPRWRSTATSRSHIHTRLRRPTLSEGRSPAWIRLFTKRLETPKARATSLVESRPPSPWQPPPATGATTRPTQRGARATPSASAVRSSSGSVLHPGHTFRCA